MAPMRKRRLIRKSKLSGAIKSFVESPVAGIWPHVKEKGCAVLAAVKAGEIPRSRHESYVRLFQELKDLRAWNGRGAGKTV